MEAKEDYYLDGMNAEEYEQLRKQCKSNETVIYKYIPYSMQEMFELVQRKMEEYAEKNEKDDPEFYQDEDYCVLLLMSDLIKQNIKQRDFSGAHGKFHQESCQVNCRQFWRNKIKTIVTMSFELERDNCRTMTNFLRSNKLNKNR